MRERRHRPPPLLRGSPPARAVLMLVGFALIAVGIVILLRANVGLGPWDVLHQGLADRTGLSFGGANVAVGVVLVGLVAVLGGRREIGAGTLANMVLIGVFVDLVLAPDPFAGLDAEPYAIRLLAAVGGTAVAGGGFALYIAAGFGAGPRDALMLLLARRTHSRIAVARTATELTALGAGLVLGGTAGPGTVLFALGIGSAIELALAALIRLRLAVPAPAPAAPRPVERV